jgi:hypothetical protein
MLACIISDNKAKNFTKVIPVGINIKQRVMLPRDYLTKDYSALGK